MMLLYKCYYINKFEGDYMYMFYNKDIDELFLDYNLGIF